jgi:signal transduction histidine kinase
MAARMGHLGGTFSLERGAKGVKVRALAPIARLDV